jgi:hypothetical protein
LSLLTHILALDNLELIGLLTLTDYRLVFRSQPRFVLTIALWSILSVDNDKVSKLCLFPLALLRLGSEGTGRPARRLYSLSRQSLLSLPSACFCMATLGISCPFVALSVVL